MNILRSLVLAGTATVSTAHLAVAGEIKVETFMGMTRLTIPVLPKDTWTSLRNGAVHKFSVNRAEHDLDPISFAADAQISKVDFWKTKTASGFNLALTCDCDVASFPGNGNTLIVDIFEKQVDPAEEASAPDIKGAVQQVVDATQKTAPAVFVKPVAIPETPIEVAIDLVPEPDLVASFTPVEEWPEIEPAAESVVRAKPAPRVEKKERPKPSVPTSRDVESSRLSRTLVATPMPRRKITKPQYSEDEEVARIRDAILEQFSNAAEAGAIALVKPKEKIDTTRRTLSKSCPIEAELDLARMVDTSDFRKPIGPLRAAVFDDMKQLNEDNVFALARHYIAFGLGAEAIGILDSFEIEGRSARLIREMGLTLEERYSELKNASLLVPDCGRIASVWRAAIIGKATSAQIGEIYDRSQGEVYELPRPLQRVLGGIIALALYDEGNVDEALRIRRGLENAPGYDTPDLVLLDAYLPSIRGVPPRPMDTLLRLSETRSSLSIDAALRAAELSLDRRDTSVSDRLLGTLQDMEYFHRNTAMGKQLSLAIAKLEAQRGDLSEALVRLDGKAKADKEKSQDWAGIRNGLIMSAAMRVQPKERPKEFLVVLGEVKKLDTKDPSAVKALLTLSRTLIDSGASHLVFDVLPKELLARSLEARQLVAEAALMRGQSRQTLKLLAGNDDTLSKALLERANALTGQEMRSETESRFEPIAKAKPTAPLATARDLIEGAASDAELIRELLIDG